MVLFNYTLTIIFTLNTYKNAFLYHRSYLQGQYQSRSQHTFAHRSCFLLLSHAHMVLYMYCSLLRKRLLYQALYNAAESRKKYCVIFVNYYEILKIILIPGLCATTDFPLLLRTYDDDLY